MTVTKTHIFTTPLRNVAGSFVLGLSICVLITLVVVAPARAAGHSCPNEAFRTVYSAALPDCRAYELVSPPGIQPYFTSYGGIGNIKYGSAVLGAELGPTIASQGSLDSGIAFFAPVAPPNSSTDGPDYLSTRGTGGWTTQNLIPPQSTIGTVGCQPYMIAWSANMERGILSDGQSTFQGSKCGADEPELVKGEPREGAQNLFVRDSATGSYQLVNQAGLLGKPANAIYQGGSSDLGVVAFSEEPGEEEVSKTEDYVWAGGTVDRLLTIRPNGEAIKGEIADAATLKKRREESFAPSFSHHAVAPDGSRIEFAAEGELYSRVNPGAPQSAFNGAEECSEPSKACTVQLDSSETLEPGGEGVFAGGSGPDGSVVYFSDVNRLTSDSTATVGEPDLYEYDFGKPLGERLTDLTVDGNVAEHANVLGFVGTNETGRAGEYAYFVATGVLASEPNSVGALPVSGAPNLYMIHEGVTSFIGTLSLSGDACDWENRCMMARVSSNGAYLGFNSLERLTGFDNRDASTAEPDQEIFLYDSGAHELSCASCGTTGTAPIAPASIRLPEGVDVTAIAFVGSLQRNVSDNGQVFFDTSNPLLPAARSGGNLWTQSNVYEYEGGQLHLLSSGTSESSSFFYDASADGGDAYFVTAQALIPGASPVEISLYDAKVGGGFPPPTRAPEACSGEACSGPQTPGALPPANATEAFAGLGNRPTLPTAGKAKQPTARARKLAAALKACQKKPKRKRASCKRRAGNANRRAGR